MPYTIKFCVTGGMQSRLEDTSLSSRIASPSPYSLRAYTLRLIKSQIFYGSTQEEGMARDKLLYFLIILLLWEERLGEILVLEEFG